MMDLYGMENSAIIEFIRDFPEIYAILIGQKKIKRNQKILERNQEKIENQIKSNRTPKSNIFDFWFDFGTLPANFPGSSIDKDMASNRLAQVQNHLAPSSDPSNLVLVSSSADGRVVTITINNARRANCLSTTVMKALLAALRSINPDISIDASVDKEDPIEFATRICRSHAPKRVPKVVILKTAGKIFCSGHDLREFHAAKGDYKIIHDIFELCNTMMLTIQRLPQIVISQVPSAALSQGHGLMVRFKEYALRQERN
jgi:hypothetical protein